MKRYLGITWLLAFAFPLVAATNAVPKIPLAGTNAVAKKAPPVVVKWEELKPPGNFIMALARDNAGNVWAGTEEKGVWRFTPDSRSRGDETQTKSEPPHVGTEKGHLTPTLSPARGGEGVWKQFTTKDGLGDDYAYAVAVDQQGRVWVGHLNHGVSVYNGTRWQNYDVPHGPIGERIFKIAVCPKDGDVWLGTSAGLTRYSVSQDTWTHYTRVDGLPSDQIAAIAFDKAGNIYVGTQCDGVAMASRASGYVNWRKAPLFTSGGLPSKLINDLLVSTGGILYAATDGGLAWSRDGGWSWQFRHGRDYPKKMAGLAGGPPPGWTPAALSKNLLPEDYVTCLAEDEAGVIWLGFRQFGVLPLSDSPNVEQEKLLAQETGKADYIRCILPAPDFRPWLASYGHGLLRAGEAWRLQEKAAVKTEAPILATNARLPSPASPPTLAELTTMLEAVKKLAAEKCLPDWKPVPRKEAIKSWQPPITYSTNVAYLGEDWRTMGDWTGRYGRQNAILSAMAAPLDHNAGWAWRIEISPHLGPHHGFASDIRMEDSLRYWVHWLKTDQPRCLYSPVVGYRRESEWDDHGEGYPMTYAGPDIWVRVGVPDGVFRVSFYFPNKDGQSSKNRFRDYLLELKPYVTNPKEWEQQPNLATGRVHDFWGGEYQSFIVTGPAQYHLKIGRNYSQNTICAGVFVDRLIGPGFDPADKSWLPFMEHTMYEPPTVPPADPARESPELLKARELWSALDAAYALPAGVAMQNPFRLAAYQTALAANAPANLLANWRWKMAWWTPEDREEQHQTVKAAYEKRTEMVRNHQPF